MYFTSNSAELDVSRRTRKDVFFLCRATSLRVRGFIARSWRLLFQRLLRIYHLSRDIIAEIVTFFCLIVSCPLFFQLTMNDFSVHRIIGRGGFGEVYGCRKADTGKM